ncbi:MAG: hypothetical protein U0175_39045 [Caldilineaceae bacterium]
MHQTVQRSINQLMVNSEEKHDAVLHLTMLKKKMLQPEHIFDLESLIYGSIVNQALAAELEGDQSSLIALSNQLAGKQTYAISYVLRYEFLNILDDNVLIAYNLLCNLLEWYTNRIDEVNKQEPNVTDYEEMYETLHTWCYASPPPKTVAELIVSQVAIFY